MHGGAGAAAHNDRSLDLFRKESRPVIGLLRPHREAIDAGDPIDAKSFAQKTLLCATLSAVVTSGGY